MKLKAMAPRLPTLASRLAPNGLACRSEADRLVAEPWRAWYKTAAWQRLRWAVLVRDLFTCQACGVIAAITSRLVGDHKVPHKGDPVLFWNPDNVQCLCVTCHDTVKRSEERRGGGV